MGLKRVKLPGGALCPAAMAAALLLGACSVGEGGEDVVAQSSPDDAVAAAPRYVVPEPLAIEPEVSSVAADIDTSNWQLKPPFYAAGSEPDWRLDLIDNWFVFQRSGLAEIDAPLIQPDQTTSVDVFETSAITVSLSRSMCEGGSYGARAVGTAEIIFDNITYAGCVYAGQSPAISAVATSDSVWKRDLTVRMIEIDACLAAVEARSQVMPSDVVITTTYPRAEGVLGVVLRTRQGRLFECGAGSSGKVVFLDPVGSAQASEVRGLFYRAENDPPPDACFEEAEELAFDNVTQGYFLPDDCGF